MVQVAGQDSRVVASGDFGLASRRTRFLTVPAHISSKLELYCAVTSANGMDFTVSARSGCKYCKQLKPLLLHPLSSHSSPTRPARTSPVQPEDLALACINKIADCPSEDALASRKDRAQLNRPRQRGGPAFAATGSRTVASQRCDKPHRRERA